MREIDPYRTLKHTIFYGTHCISLYFPHKHNANSLDFTGWPLLNINLAADLALSASIDDMNERSLTFNLYRATHKAVSQVNLMAGF